MPADQNGAPDSGNSETLQVITPFFHRLRLTDGFMPTASLTHEPKRARFRITLDARVIGGEAMFDGKVRSPFRR